MSEFRSQKMPQFPGWNAYFARIIIKMRDLDFSASEIRNALDQEKKDLAAYSSSRKAGGDGW